MQQEFACHFQCGHFTKEDMLDVFSRLGLMQSTCSFSSQNKKPSEDQ